MRAPELPLADVVPGRQLEALLRGLRPTAPGATAVLLALAEHPDPGVRSVLAQRLPLLAHGGGGPAPELVDAVAGLCDDAHPRVREAACFALGTLWRDLDRPRVRDALAARLDDADVDVSDEALLGLAHRHDPRALTGVRRALGRPPGGASRLVLEAAGAVGDVDLHELVLAHAEAGDWEDDDLDVVEAVVRLTDPAGLGDDLLGGIADLCRAAAHGLPPGRAVAAWEALDGVLDVAPRRAVQALEEVAARLDDDPAALAHLRERSALGALALAASSR